MENVKVIDDVNSALRVCPCKECKTSMPIKTFISLFNGCRIVVGYHDKEGKFMPITEKDVSDSLPSEMEAHEHATTLYEDQDYGDAKYDGYMDCFREMARRK